MYILEISCLSVASFAIIFSHSEGYLFTLLIVSFDMQKLLSLIRSHLFMFVFKRSFSMDLCLLSNISVLDCYYSALFVTSNLLFVLCFTSISTTGSMVTPRMPLFAPGSCFLYAVLRISLLLAWPSFCPATSYTGGIWGMFLLGKRSCPARVSKQ